MVEESKKYILVDTEALITCLTEDAFNEETKEVPDDDKYEMITVYNPGIPGQASISKQIKPHWASTFFNLRAAYEIVVNKFTKK